MSTIYTLRDTFNNVAISRHKTFAAAAALSKHLRGVKRANGANSYLTYEIILPSGERVKDFEIDN